jgi:hypothetical protein
MLRTVYYPATRRGISRPLGMFLVFLLSAFFHELLVGLPLHMVRAWAFFGILGQVPLIVATNWLKSRCGTKKKIGKKISGGGRPYLQPASSLSSSARLVST